MIEKIRSFLEQQNLDFFILPNSDEFFSEYVPSSDKRVEFISGFTGSNATIIFSKTHSYFFTDGRYITQAQNQLDLSQFTICNIAQISVLAWLSQNAALGQKIAVDPRLTALRFANSCRDLSLNLVFLPKNPIDEIWHNRSSPSSSEIYDLPLAACGEDSLSKRQRIAAQIGESEALLITKPENLCWMLNIRAGDVEFTPLLLAYGLLLKSGKMVIFLERKREFKLDLPMVEVVETAQIAEFFAKLRLESGSGNKFPAKPLTIPARSVETSFLIQLDESSTNCWLHEILKRENFIIHAASCPIEMAKAIKNSAEIAGARLAHELDAVAIIKFLVWFENAMKAGQALDEMLLAKKLLEFRRKSPSFCYPSFETIAGFSENGAIIHYKASPETNKQLVGNSLFLLDSGGQYLSQNFFGTTDITRTFIVGKSSESMIRDYTLVLKGHLALARVKFPRKTTGAQLDSLSRFYLWQFGKDYDHGTGHGVGAFMSVHEGPCSISKRSNCELVPGMILSNEPGFYEVGQYGIRLENLQLVQEFDEKFLCFETLSLVPFEPELIDFSMLTYPEKKWLNSYHQKIINRLKPCLERPEIEFLEKISQKFA